MGICIAYSGELRELGLVPELVSDLKARGEAVGASRMRAGALPLR
jgi:hypothetical protein